MNGPRALPITERDLQAPHIRLVFSQVPEPPWTQDNGVRSVVNAWRASGSIRRCFTAERALPPAEPSFAAVPSRLHESLHRALNQRGIAQLYTHQVEAVD